MLTRDDFLFVVDKAPLVAVDLVFVRNSGEVLLGRRLNRPAEGYWFVPGGRIRKNETLGNALLRVADSELGLGSAFRSGALIARQTGAYEHFYSDCFAGDFGVSTHYVVLGHRIDVDDSFEPKRIDAQHAELRWWTIDEALACDTVHRFTKDYLYPMGTE